MAPESRHDAATRQELIVSHRPDAIRARLGRGREDPYLKDFIYGAIDGAVTTFAVVAGVEGADLSYGVVIILGIANLLGDGFSMAASNFLGTKAEAEQLRRFSAMETRHIETVPDGEREEIRQIFKQKGFEGDLLEQVVDVMTSDRQRWIDTMLQEEHGLSLTPVSPWKAAAATLVSFLLVGALPLLPFMANQVSTSTIVSNPFFSSCVMTAVAFFLVGAAKARYVDRHWLFAGLETLFVGGIAAGLAYVCGLFLKGIV